MHALRDERRLHQKVEFTGTRNVNWNIGVTIQSPMSNRYDTFQYQETLAPARIIRETMDETGLPTSRIEQIFRSFLVTTS